MYYHSITMEVAQFRIPKGLLNEVDKLVEKGFYSNKSDVIRDALRRLILENQVGSIKSKENSVKEVRRARGELSKKFSESDLKKINELK